MVSDWEYAHALNMPRGEYAPHTATHFATYAIKNFYQNVLNRIPREPDQNFYIMTSSLFTESETLFQYQKISTGEK